MTITIDRMTGQDCVDLCNLINTHTEREREREKEREDREDRRTESLGTDEVILDIIVIIVIIEVKEGWIGDRRRREKAGDANE